MKITEVEWWKMQLPWYVDEWDSMFWQKIIGAGVGFCITWFAVQRFLAHKRITQKLEKKRASIKASCQRLRDLLAKDRLGVRHRDRILGLSVNQLQADLQSGNLKAKDVLRAYQSKAMEVDLTVNCVTEPIWEAEAQARELDEDRGVKGPLHGIPVSIKEGYTLKGYDCTGGYLHFVNKPQEEDGAFIEVLRQQGAIPFVRTNIPQTMMTFDSSNPIYGETRNPHNLSKSPGGSSSGEGALIAAGGSCLGLGNDIGGSVRIPAHFCGVCGLKPTSERLGTPGMLNLGIGLGHVKISAGPLGKDVESLVMFMQAMLVPALNKAWPFVQVKPFDMEIYRERKSLRIGYFSDNKVMSPVPAVSRAVDMARRVLERKGHTLVEFAPPKVEYAFSELLYLTFFGDNAKEARSYLEEDVVDPTAVQMYYTFKLPFVFRYFLGLILQLLDANIGRMFRRRIRDVADWLKLGGKIEAYKAEFVAAMKKQNLDAIISPTMPMPAIPLCKSNMIPGAVSYTGIYNILNFPAGCVPVTKVTAKDQSELNNPTVYPAKNLHEKMAVRLSQDSEGLPVSVQCAALPYQEELVLRVMKDVQDGVAYNKEIKHCSS